MVLISWLFFISPNSFAVSIVRIVHGKHVIHRSHLLLMCSNRTIAREEKCFKTENNRNIPENKTIKWTRSLSIVQSQSRNYNTQHWRLCSKLGMNAVWFTLLSRKNKTLSIFILFYSGTWMSQSKFQFHLTTCWMRVQFFSNFVAENICLFFKFNRLFVIMFNELCTFLR